jgi:hypothetical protein
MRCDKKLVGVMLASVLFGASPALAQETSRGQSVRFDALSNLPLEQNRPTPETAKTLMQELAFQQATQAYLWAMPLINTLGMKFGSERYSAQANLRVYGPDEKAVDYSWRLR